MESFIWMFKEKDFAKHYIFLSAGTVIMFLLALGVILALTFLQSAGSLNKIVYMIVFVTVSILPALFMLGYFWNLTENIINREMSIESDNVYNGKIRKICKIELPELKPLSFIWRGFASMVANILIIVPYFLLITLSVLTGSFASIPPQAVIAGAVFYCLFFPALFLNYAKQNSVFAVLNIPKAVSIFGNYPFRYLWAIILLGIVYGVNFFLDNVVVQFFLPKFTSGFGAESIFPIIILAIYFIFTILKNFYLIFVIAHILGTIVPPSES